MRYILLDSLNFGEVTTNIIDSINNAVTYTDNKRVFARLPLHFDTETSTVEDYSFVYISQLGVNKTPVYSRCFNLMLTALLSITNALKVSVRIGIHNTGFDWAFMQNFMINNAEKYNISVDALLNKPHSPITVTLTNAEGHVVQFVDTALIFNMSLEKVGEKYTTSKKQVGKLDYNKVRHSLTPLTNDELDYCMYDVIVGCEALEYIYEHFTDLGKTFPITSTGIVRQNLKINYKEQGADSPLMPTYNNKVSFSKYFPKTYDEYKFEFCDYLFRGGYTHGNIFYLGDIVENVTCVDFTSSYPAVMQQKTFPMTAFKKIGSVHYDKYTDGHDLYIPIGGKNYAPYLVESMHTVWDVTFTNLRATTFHSLESESKVINIKNMTKQQIQDNFVIDNGRIFAGNVVHVLLTELDYHNYTRAYTWESVEVHAIKYAQGSRLPQYLRDTMTVPYINKAKLKQQGKSYDAEKALVNSTYGMCVQRLNLTSYKINTIDGDLIDTTQADYDDKTKNKCEEQVKLEIEKYNQQNSTDYTISTYRTNATLNKTIDEIYTKQAYKTACASRILNPYWGLYISAHARHNLVQTLFDIEDACLNSVVYYDTDSLYIRDIENVNHIITEYNDNIHEINKTLAPNDRELWDLGEFTYDPVCTRFKHLGAKRYVKQIGDKIKSTVAGLKKNYFNRFEPDEAFEKFTHSFVVDKMLTGKMSSTYFNDVLDIEVTDYLGETHTEHIQGGVVLAPVDFTLMLSEMYTDLANRLKK